MPNFWTTAALFGYFWTRIFKSYCRISNKPLQICENVKFWEKSKMAKFVTKNALFGYFWVRILKHFCHI